MKISRTEKNPDRWLRRVTYDERFVLNTRPDPKNEEYPFEKKILFSNHKHCRFCRFSYSCRRSSIFEWDVAQPKRLFFFIFLSLTHERADLSYVECIVTNKSGYRRGIIINTVDDDRRRHHRCFGQKKWCTDFKPKFDWKKKQLKTAVSDQKTAQSG